MTDLLCRILRISEGTATRLSNPQFQFLGFRAVWLDYKSAHLGAKKVVHEKRRFSGSIEAELERMFEFPFGAKFYDWNSLPMATVSGPQGRTILSYAVEPPCEIISVIGLCSAREVGREAFEVLRSAQRALMLAA